MGWVLVVNAADLGWRERGDRHVRIHAFRESSAGARDHSRSPHRNCYRGWMLLKMHQQKEQEFRDLLSLWSVSNY
jgi:hypothetical protein